MEFEFTTTIYISNDDLKEMYLKVKEGENFDDVFEDIMSAYEDEDYYNSHYIYDQVEEEINRRLRQTERNKK